MKRFVLWLVILGLFFSNAFALDRNYINLNSTSVNVKDNGNIAVQRPNKLNDTVVLVKGIGKSVNLSRFTDNQVHQEIVQFFERIVTQYRFKNSDRPYIAYGALGNGWFGKGLYKLKISEIMKLNNRDFGKNDMNLVDSDGNKFIPLKVLFSNLTVINPSSLTEDREATRLLRNYVKSYKFGGGLGIGESMVENSWNGLYAKKKGVDKILRNSDGSYAVMCKDDSYGTITFPTSSICASGNGKSDCKPSYKWSKERAATFICN